MKRQTSQKLVARCRDVLRPARLTHKGWIQAAIAGHLGMALGPSAKGTLQPRFERQKSMAGDGVHGPPDESGQQPVSLGKFPEDDSPSRSGARMRKIHVMHVMHVMHRQGLQAGGENSVTSDL